MNLATYLIRLNGKDIDGGHVSCLGEQLKSILQQLEAFTTDCRWYAADVDAYQSLPMPLIRGVGTPMLVGNTSKLIAIAEKVDQFQSGVFLAIAEDVLSSQWTQVFFTEDEPFREMGQARFEIRAFDTTYFEVYARDLNLLQVLQERYRSRIILKNL